MTEAFVTDVEGKLNNVLRFHKCPRGLYVITDPKTTAHIGLLETVRQAIRGGAKYIQYRDKHATKQEQLHRACALAAICREHSLPLIINDDAELAVASRAAGVHIGKDDSDYRSVRRLVGYDRIVGVSCYNSLRLAKEAERDGADYVAFGSVFPSVTKPDARKASLSLLEIARAEIEIPIVAIGGITIENAARVFAAGADIIAVISAIWCTADPEAAARQFVNLLPN